MAAPPHRATPEEQADLFDRLLCDYRRTEQAAGNEIERFYRLGRGAMRLCFAGAALLPVIEPALQHLSTAPIPSPALTVYLWDRASAATGTPLLLRTLRLALSWYWQGFLDSRGEISGYDGERFRASFHPGPNTLSMLDRDKRRAVYWADEAPQVPWHETGSPMRSILNWSAGGDGYQFVHAAAVGTGEAAVLIVGKGGSGKSTAALACLEAGMRYLGDDYTLVATHPAPVVYSLYNTAKLKCAADLARFPSLAAGVSNVQRGEDEKAMIFLAAHRRDRLAAELPLKAILIPSITGESQTSFRPATSGAALAALAPSTLLQLAGSSAAALKAMSALVKRLPCFELRLGTDIRRIPEAISDLLVSLGNSAVA